MYLYGQSKVDIDAGVLAGRPPTGVAATDDASAILDSSKETPHGFVRLRFVLCHVRLRFRGR
ncbi:MAG: hypothetical protein QOG14_3003 [Mycobacterium sp.]|jgi:hypothetical protein|nr:hypothetical protein [Mycobacterium sp.]